jgi:hypothetical protein
MFPVIANLPELFVIYLAASMLLWTIRLNHKLKSSLVLDWGPQPNRFRERGMAVLIASYICTTWTDSPDLGLILTWLCMGLFALQSALTTIPRQGIYEDGMFLMTKFLWGTQGRFIRWSEIQDYRWDEQGRLAINPGWHSITCKVTFEMVDDLKAVLKEKCPDAELATPVRMS